MKRSFLVVIGLAVLISVSLAFTSQPPVYKNLKILPKNITERQMDSVMENYSLSLGVGCDFCHVENKTTQVWDYASDKKKHKLIAREMMLMTTAINEKYFQMTAAKITLDSKLMVTCYTCHNGKKEPEVIPHLPIEVKKDSIPVKADSIKVKQ